MFGLIAGFIFILVQLVLYIDFAFNLNESWVGKMEDASDDRLVASDISSRIKCILNFLEIENVGLQSCSRQHS